MQMQTKTMKRFKGERSDRRFKQVSANLRSSVSVRRLFFDVLQRVLPNSERQFQQDVPKNDDQSILPLLLAGSEPLKNYPKIKNNNNKKSKYSKTRYIRFLMEEVALAEINQTLVKVMKSFQESLCPVPWRKCSFDERSLNVFVFLCNAAIVGVNQEQFEEIKATKASNEREDVISGRVTVANSLTALCFSWEMIVR
ncbi:hypothetical protein D9C73_010430 [Collichthys lucidus]|uniref:Uncharacterized protein n=1 Tax=Collichthys lucidus TaxID=240159 RepID=A0A4U5UL23_COLLU|nr:hypothetical protein D9C73_010430 [Collichthys lucidus]